MLCEYLIELAKSRFNPFLQQNNPGNSSSSNSIKNQRKNSVDQFTVADNSFKKLEQLVIYLKCLQLLKPVLSYAKDELMLKHLKSTLKVKKIMRQLNNMYKFCLYQSKQLYNTESVQTKWANGNINLNADRLLYIHAIELCRESAMEEFFGKPHKVGCRIMRGFSLSNLH